FKVSSADLRQLTYPTPFHVPAPEHRLVAAGILKYIPLLWGLTDLDIYGSWLKFMEKHFAGKARVVPFFYDWRRDNRETVVALSQLITSLHEEGFSKIYLVAHSMGGLVTSYYLRYGAQQPETAIETWEGARAVDKVVLAGVPFRGAMQTFS